MVRLLVFTHELTSMKVRQVSEVTFPNHRSNDIVSGVLHFIGVGCAIAILVVLIVVGARYGGPWHVVGYSLYGSGLILLYLASSSYHLVPYRFVRTKLFLQRLDHAMIYVLIAATYTPITFVSLHSGWRWSMFGVIWGLAVVGCMFKLGGWRLHRGLWTALYVVMGWLIVIAFAPLQVSMSVGQLWLLVSGGISYTVGVIFFVLDRVLIRRRYFWMHEIFHLFVLGGSALHTIVMFTIV